ncbi:MAG: J domain-containing protein [Pirellulales bacterium]
MTLYEILQVERTASSQEIKAAYYKLAQKQHPDLGGDRDEFQKLEQAYKVLSDPEQRAIYDETGQVPGLQNELQARIDAELASLAVQAFADNCGCPISRICESIDNERSGLNSRIAKDRFRLKRVTEQLEKFKLLNVNVETEAKSLIIQAIEAHLIQVQQSIDDAIEEVEFCNHLLASLNGLVRSEKINPFKNPISARELERLLT